MHKKTCKEKKRKKQKSKDIQSPSNCPRCVWTYWCHTFQRNLLYSPASRQLEISTFLCYKIALMSHPISVLKLKKRFKIGKQKNGKWPGLDSIFLLKIEKPKVRNYFVLTDFRCLHKWEFGIEEMATFFNFQCSRRFFFFLFKSDPGNVVFPQRIIIIRFWTTSDYDSSVHL